MRKTILLTATILCSLQAMAQPWLEKFEGQRIKLEDVVEGYRKKNPVQDNTNTDHAIEFEGKGYHFHRWLNFWEGRTDENGYLVSTRKHWEEMKKIRATYATNRSAAKNTSNDVNWTFHGPTNPLGGNFGVGRINVIEFHPTDTNTYMIGTPGGGIWRTTTDGSSWTALDDFLPILGVSDIDYNPKNPNTVYVCTGDRDANDTYSMGVFKSTDGGTTWDTTGFHYSFSDLKKTNGLLINPLDTNSLTLATTDGIFKSADAGATWVFQFGGNFQQILAHPTDTAIMFASGSIGSGGRSLYRSADGGATWQNIIAPSSISRIEIAVTAANPAIVKFVAANTQYGLDGIYNSTDTGKTFTRIFDGGGSNCNTNILASTPDGDECGGQGWYDLSIQISPLNANDVIVGGVNTWFSRTGGTSWTVANQWRNTVTGVTIVHADKHFHKFHPLKPNILYECNDGGLYRTGAPMSSDAIWTDISEGLGITQFYRNAVANNTSYVLGGTQDNGSKMLIGGTSKQMTGADGMDCQIDPVDSNILYTSQQYGELRRSTNGGQNFTDIQNNIPGRPDGAWITPLIIHPAGRNILLAGYNYVYLSLDYGDSWSAISPNFFNNITRLATTPIDQDYIYMAIVTQSSTLRYTSDLGANWKGITPLNQNTVSDIMADPRDKDLMWVTYRTYNGDKVAVVDLRTNTWTRYNANLPEVPVNCIAFDQMNQTFYIGTDLGVYYREYNDPNWKYFNNNTLPNVEIFDLGINNTSNTIWAATYGRGMWSSPVHKSTTSVSNTIPLATDVITIAPNPNYGTFDINTRNSVLLGKSTTVRIVNMLGATVWSNVLTINNNGNANVKAELPRGTYMVEIIYDNTVFAKSKMVVY